MFNQLEESVIDLWSEKGNFVAKATYSISDNIYLFLQSLPFGALVVNPNNRSHLNGDFASQSEVEDAFVSTSTMLVPGPKTPGLFKKMTASQFSKTFKGSLSRLAPKTRGGIIKFLNKAGEFGNASLGKIASKFGIKQGEKVKENLIE